MVYESGRWIKSYSSGTDWNMEFPDISLARLLAESLQRNANRTALHFLGVHITFEELYEKSLRFAKMLNEWGVCKGDVVAVSMPNTPQTLISAIGTVLAGCIYTGISPLLTSGEMQYQLKDCGAKVLVITEKGFQSALMPIAQDIPEIELLLITGVTDMVQNVQPNISKEAIPGKKIASFTEMLNMFPNEPPKVSLVGTDPCYYLYTGGTTGRSKGAVHTHSGVVSNIRQFLHWFQVEEGKEILLSAFPLFHIAGMMYSIAALASGTTQIVIPDPRNLEHVVNEYATHKPTMLINVPSLYMMLLGNASFRSQDFSCVKYCLFGASPFSLEGIKAMEEVIGEGKLGHGYGLTECGVTTMSPVGCNKEKLGSIGLPWPGTVARVVQVGGEADVPLGERGELLFSGPQVMKEYLNNPDETSRTLVKHDGRVWLRTGDVGFMDKDGFIYIVDRVKDMIIVGGYKVYSSEVEDKFHQHPAIGMCALVGIPNSQRPDSEIVKLYVQTSEAYKGKPESRIEEELISFARKTMAPYKVPKIVEFVDAMPLTAVGKLDKKVLRAAYITNS